MKRTSQFYCSILASIFFPISSAYSALISYEGYTYGASANFGSLSPNGNTVGLDTSSAYTGSGLTNLTYTSSGMTFGNLVTSGGAVNFGTATTVLAAKSSLTSAYTGMLYSSILVNFTSKGSNASHGFVTRIADSATTDTGSRINSFADSRSGSSLNAGIAYGGVYNSGTKNATTGLDLGQTYIVITSWSRVGEDFSAENGVGILYALTLEQFGAMTASSNWQDYLTATEIGANADQISVRVVSNLANTGSATLGADLEDYFHTVTSGNSGTFDELRYGSTLESVLPLIPEPSSVMLASLASLTLFRRCRS